MTIEEEFEKEYGKSSVDGKLHFCLEWDGLLIDSSFPEFAACTCFPKEIPKEGERNMTYEEIKSAIAEHGTLWQDEDGYWYVDQPKLGEGETEEIAIGMAALALWPETGVPPSKSLASPAEVEEKQSGSTCQYCADSGCASCVDLFSKTAGIEERVEWKQEERLIAANNLFDRLYSEIEPQYIPRREVKLMKLIGDEVPINSSTALDLQCELNSLRSKQSEIERENLELKKYAPRWVEQAKGVTHSEGCWQDHRGCALDKISDLIQLVREMRAVLVDYQSVRDGYGEERDREVKDLCRRADELLEAKK